MPEALTSDLNYGGGMTEVRLYRVFLSQLPSDMLWSGGELTSPIPLRLWLRLIQGHGMRSLVIGCLKRPESM